MLAAAVAFRLIMFLVPYTFVMVTGFGLASTAAGQNPWKPPDRLLKAAIAANATR